MRMKMILTVMIFSFGVAFQSLESCLDQCGSCTEGHCVSTLAYCPTIYTKDAGGQIVSEQTDCNQISCTYQGFDCKGVNP